MISKFSQSACDMSFGKKEVLIKSLVMHRYGKLGIELM
jgi:hypothetical protein